MSDPRTHRWPLRLAKASPLIAAALLLFLGLSLPLPFPYSVMTLAYPPMHFMGNGTAEPGMEDATLDLRAAEQANIIAYTPEPEPEMFVSAAEETWARVNTDPVELFSGDTFVSVPFSHDDEVYEPIVAWEDANDAVVWAWIVTTPDMPPIVASARGRDGVIIAPQPVWVPSADPQDVEPREPDVVDDGADAIAPWLWREAHASDSVVPALDTSMFRRGIGGGAGSGVDVRFASTIVADGVAWRAITLFTIEDPDDVAEWPTVPVELVSKDPRAAGYDAWLKDLADEHEMDVWIFGPLESDAIPLRVPAGHDESEAQELGAQVWPSWYLQTTGVAQVPRIAEFEDAVARIAGGPVGTMYAASWMYQMSSSVYMTGGDVAPPSIAFLVVWDEMPVEPPGVLRSVWHAWQVFVARHTRPIMGSGYLLMLVSLVLSPTAFVIDRGRRIRVRAAEERERMHRDAHDKVYNRLSALSKRVAEVGGAATNGTAGSLGAIAEEIRYTVGELQEILGDDVEHTSSAFADVPMADQLAAVCGAQAASLGVSVQCDVGPGVPLVSPRLGWDLQCIAEEAITNAVRHGDASRVRVHLDLGASDTVVLVVTDDGCGTSVTSADVTAESSTGLRGIRDRAARHGGHMDLQSTGDGTTLMVTILFVPEVTRESGDTTARTR